MSGQQSHDQSTKPPENITAKQPLPVVMEGLDAFGPGSEELSSIDLLVNGTNIKELPGQVQRRVLPRVAGYTGNQATLAMLGLKSSAAPSSTPILRKPIEVKHLDGLEQQENLESDKEPGSDRANQGFAPPSPPPSNGDSSSSSNALQRKLHSASKWNGALGGSQASKLGSTIQRELASEEPLSPPSTLEDAVAKAANEVAGEDPSSESAPSLDEMATETPLGNGTEGVQGEAAGGGGGAVAIAGEVTEPANSREGEPPVPEAVQDKDATQAQAEAEGAEQQAKQEAEKAKTQDGKAVATQEAQPAAEASATPVVPGTAPSPEPTTTPAPEPGTPAPTTQTAPVTSPAQSKVPGEPTTEQLPTSDTSETATKEKEGEEKRPERGQPLQRAHILHIQRKLAPTSPKSDPAFQAVVRQSKAVATREKTHAPAKQKAQEASAAAKMPPEEKKGKAQDQQSGAIKAEAASQAAKASGGSAPGFNKAEFVSDVMARIDQSMPQDPRKMENIESSGAFDNAERSVNNKVASGKEQAQGNVDDRVRQEPNTGAVAEKAVSPLKPNEPGAMAAVPNATGAAPKSKGSEEVEAPLQQESKALDQQMVDAKITEEQLEKSNEPQFQKAVASKKDAQEHVKSDPAAFRQNEKGSIASAQAEAQTLEEAKVQGMHDGRAQTFGQMDALQSTTVGKDEGKRAEIGKQIDTIYLAAKGDVEGILKAMDSKVDQEFSAGAAQAKTEAIDYIKRETKAYKDRRYRKEQEGVLNAVAGAVTEAWDNFTSMPDEYFEYFKTGRDKYTTKMRGVLDKVGDIVKDHLDRAKQRIEQGKKEIQDFIAKQPESLREIAEELAGDAMTKFDSLEQTVDSKREELVSSLAAKYVETLQSLDAELEQMKEADKGFLEKAKEAVAGVIDTIMELKAMLENTLSRAAAAIEKIIKDPITFLGNLISGVKQGLSNFVSNIGTHLQAGLISWLTGAVASAGLQMPAQLDLPGIFSLVMQVLGLTYQNVRTQVVKGLGPQGETIVGALEKAWEIFQVFQQQGIAGLWQYLKDMVGDLKTMVIEEIKSMVTNEVIKAGINWLIGILGGPAGAFIKAVQAIISVVTWFINNGSRLMALVNSIIDSVSAIANGDIGGAAKYIENSLAQSLPLVISFLADLLGLGGISRKVQDIFKKVKAPIEKGIQWIIKQAKAMAKKIMGFLGGGKGGKNKDKEPGKADSLETQKKVDDGLRDLYAEETRVSGNGKLSEEEAETAAAATKSKHPVFKSIRVKRAETKWQYDYTIQRETVDSKKPAEEADETPQAKFMKEAHTLFGARLFKKKEWMALVERLKLSNSEGEQLLEREAKRLGSTSDTKYTLSAETAANPTNEEGGVLIQSQIIPGSEMTYELVETDEIKAAVAAYNDALRRKRKAIDANDVAEAERLTGEVNSASERVGQLGRAQVMPQYNKDRKLGLATDDKGNLLCEEGRHKGDTDAMYETTEGTALAVEEKGRLRKGTGEGRTGEGLGSRIVEGEPGVRAEQGSVEYYESLHGSMERNSEVGSAKYRRAQKIKQGLAAQNLQAVKCITSIPDPDNPHQSRKLTVTVAQFKLVYDTSKRQLKALPSGEGKAKKNK